MRKEVETVFGKETKFETEQKGRRTVLFPIRLDDAVMKTEEAWTADIRRTRDIGDFLAWKSHDRYIEALRRLLLDLKWGEGETIKEKMTSRNSKLEKRNLTYRGGAPTVV